MTEQKTATTREAIRNVITEMQSAATASRIVLRLFAAHRHPLTVLYDMEDAGEVTCTPCGAYVLGAHKTTNATDLVLTSADPLFGQPGLF